MKKFLSFVFIYLGVCYLISNISSDLNVRIIYNNTITMLNEIDSRLSKEETMYIPGETVLAYVLNYNNSDIAYNNSVISQNEVDLAISNTQLYEVKKQENKLTVIKSENNSESSFYTVNSVDKKILLKNIGLNALGLFIGFLMIIIYNKSERNRVKRRRLSAAH